MYRLVLIIISMFSLWASPALAKDARAHMWVVSQLSGDARVIRGGLQQASLKVNAQLAPGDMVVTGATGRATLARGADYIVMAPRSELRLPATPQPNGFTRVMQNIGTMLFKIRHTGVPHFAVDTPMLAAVVKGTTFTVIVDKERSAVQVTEGAVEVAATDGGMKRLVEGGRTLFINHSDPKTLIDADARTSATTAATSNAVKISGSGNVSVASIAEGTAGLIRAEAAPQPARGGPVATVVSAVPVPRATGSNPIATTPTTTAPTVTPPAATPPAAGVPGASPPSVTAPPPVPVPDVAAPTVTTPDVAPPTVTVPEVTVPEVTVPEVTVPETTTPVVTVPEVTTPVVTVPEVTVPVVTTPTVTVPTVTVPGLGI